ncbi:N-acetyl-alpha-D-glucosaminyl L-malate synthase [Chryseobacterium aquaeductus]|uniref:N-acetyl-alpha-D-glucosaminyl L-malate synthase n=2 Tax=Chryseobacterium aquaeductus TaxID=2675056 RepID=A0A9N8MF09_9FLAO|nr:N-acetyl-alpha-D-glucosaminyl L-malate synthase [Chryseobacterium potabilaquae]CAD7804100.1 N-acetyl-alpha-D-glucosaminyl L-malate synthase [Chryseobacterium aquaeductus]
MKNNKIKVLFRHRSMEMGGVEKVILSMLNHLDTNKFQMTICLNLNQGELRNEFPKHIRKVYIADGKEDFSKNSVILKLQLAKRKLKLQKAQKKPQIVQKLLNENFDIEIAPTYAAFSSVLNSLNKNSKKIGWFHSDITFPNLQPLVPEILKQIPQFDYFIFGSQQTKDVLIETYPNLMIPENQVILNAIPIEELRDKAAVFKPEFPNKPIFVSVARLNSRKGFHKLMDAHSKLLKDGFDHHIIVIGDGDEKENLKRQAENLGVNKSFLFLGSLLNPYPYVKNADFFILPSESESWPLIIADALILQKPIISTNVGGIPEMITHGKTGYLINYETTEMYDAMKKFITEPEFVSNIQKNLHNIEKQFDNQKIFDAVENIISKLVEK